MLAVGLAFLAAFGFASTAIFARVGMQGVKPLPTTLISLVVSFLPAILAACITAIPDIRALPVAGYGWLASRPGCTNFPWRSGCKLYCYRLVGGLADQRHFRDWRGFLNDFCYVLDR